MNEDEAVKLVLLKFAESRKFQRKEAAVRRPLPFAWTRATVAEWVAKRDEERRLRIAARNREYIRQFNARRP